MRGYYSEKLAAERLRACYDLASPAVTAYLEAEIGFVLERVAPSMRVLELGCGYGRVLRRLAEKAGDVVGIDTSPASLRLVRDFVAGMGEVRVAAMNAIRLGFPDQVFDATICIQNGVSAFGVDQRELVAEAVRVTRSGGRVLFSSYSAAFWADRLAWFEAQAAHGLVGEIDRDATRAGVIVCKDGFRATTLDADGFAALARSLGLGAEIAEVNRSSLFCELTVP